jgi:hypothetical protein
MKIFFYVLMTQIEKLQCPILSNKYNLMNYLLYSLNVLKFIESILLNYLENQIININRIFIDVFVLLLDKYFKACYCK